MLRDRLQKFTCQLKECLHENRGWINPATYCKDPTSISRMYLQEKLNLRLKIRNYDSLMPFPALSAILSVRCNTQICCTAALEPGWTCLAPTRASSRQPSDLPYFVSLVINSQLLWLLWMLTVTQAMVWCCFRQSTLSHILQLQEDTALTVPWVMCPTIISIPIASHGTRCLGLVKGFTSRGEINPKQVKKI